MSAFDEFISGTNEITLSKGERVNVPPLTWGKELRIYNIITKIFSRFPAGDVDDDNLNVSSELAYTFMTSFATDITEIAALVFDKDKKWVESNLTSQDMVDFVVPLSLHVFGKLGKGLSEAVNKLAEETSEVTV